MCPTSDRLRGDPGERVYAGRRLAPGTAALLWASIANTLDDPVYLDFALADLTGVAACDPKSWILNQPFSIPVIRSLDPPGPSVGLYGIYRQRPKATSPRDDASRAPPGSGTRTRTGADPDLLGPPPHASPAESARLGQPVWIVSPCGPAPNGCGRPDKACHPSGLPKAPRCKGPPAPGRRRRSRSRASPPPSRPHRA
jgi:hypothetical protein